MATSLAPPSAEICPDADNVKKETESDNVVVAAASMKPTDAAASAITASSKDEGCSGGSGNGSIGDLVASHYNNLGEKGKDQRKESRIFHMRNLNNWIKSQLINEYVGKIRTSRGEGCRINVMDLGCGKGGDLLKWCKARVEHVVCCDIAQTSVEQCQDRYRDMTRKNQRLFSADFHAADCTKTRLRDLYRHPERQFDIVSCQFAFHYCFESVAQADCMLRNASENLRVGGFFIGTTPDAYDIVDRVRPKEGGGDGNYSVGNGVYSITFDDPDIVKSLREDPSKLPLFGARYKFHLEGVVDCPEFLVHFPTLEKLAKKHGLMLVAKRRFENYYTQFQSGQGLDLLKRMNALETYPPFAETTTGLVGAWEGGEEMEAENYGHAKEYLAKLAAKAKEEGTNEERVDRIGTLSKEEWEAAKIYLIFAFKKMEDV